MSYDRVGLTCIIPRPAKTILPKEGTTSMHVSKNRIAIQSASLFICLAAIGPTVGVASEQQKNAQPQLQIINGTSQTVDVFWLKSDEERVSNGSIAPGK